jgi:hypothetical protein
MLALPVFAAAQAVDQQKLDSFAAAVAQAEGFGVKHALPTRNHNPGDLKRVDHYIHFRNDAEGWAALRTQVAKLAAGQSKHYRLSMTINQVSKIYAGDYRWGKIVAKALGVSPATTLAEYFAPAPQQDAAQDVDLSALLGQGFPFDSQSVRAPELSSYSTTQY